jgi:shikimate dehydrogenase
MHFRLGLIGQQIQYSLSPVIYQWMFKQAGCTGEYSVHDLTSESVENFLNTTADWHGLNVTTPFKTLLADKCNELSEQAQAIGAVNTLYWCDGELCGDNTDAFGFRYALQSIGRKDSLFGQALIIGSGGAARAALYGLSLDFPETEIAVASRDPQRALAEIQPLANRFLALKCVSLDDAAAALPGYDLVIQATPVGSAKCPGSPLPGELHFRENATVLDLVYAPQETAFLKAARAQSATTANGLVMLIAQATESFELWTGEHIPVQTAVHELLPQLEQR